MPRLFTGVEIPTDVSFDLEIMKGGIIGARWLDREIFHITLRFISDIDATLAREIAYELDGVEARPFSLRLKGIEVLGLPAEQRKFVPHVSLARLKEPDLHGLHRFVASHNLYRSRMFEVDRFVLFSSRPTRGGGPYAVEESYDLQAAQ